MRSRARVTVFVAGVLLLLSATGAVAVPLPSPDPCDALVTGTMNVTKLQRYEKCRLDRIEQAIPVATVTAPPVTVTATVTTGPAATDVSPTPTSTTSASATTTTSPPAAGVTLRDVDGGTGYYGQWTTNSVPTDTSFFPVGVWMETGWNAGFLTGLGINMIINPVEGPGAGIINIAALDDEADMWGGPGDAPWTGNYPGQGDICVPVSAKCGYTVQRQGAASHPASDLLYANYGKGVLFWETRDEAARFVNEFQDVTSIDEYWFTDPHVCIPSQGGAFLGVNRDLTPAECRLAANYGKTVDWNRALLSPARSEPVWAFVELGHPFTEADAPTITPAQARAAVWSSLIHEARGILYFNHSFGGSCVSHHVLTDCGAPMRTAVSAVNAQIRSLAPVLNGPNVDGLVTVTGRVDVLAKKSGADMYLLAGSAQPGAQTATVRLACGAVASAEVIGESRTVPVVDGRFSDGFADGNAVHIYKIPGGGAACGL
jgi:hypothetical protein